MVTNLVYVIWASGEVQSFNTPHLKNKSFEEEGSVTSKEEEQDDVKKYKVEQ